jgi:hypothetical protein
MSDNTDVLNYFSLIVSVYNSVCIMSDPQVICMAKNSFDKRLYLTPVVPNAARNEWCVVQFFPFCNYLYIYLIHCSSQHFLLSVHIGIIDKNKEFVEAYFYSIYFIIHFLLWHQWGMKFVFNKWRNPPVL